MKTRAGRLIAAKIERIRADVEKAAEAGVAEAAHLIANEVRALAPNLTGDLFASVVESEVKRIGDLVVASVIVSEPGVGSEEYGDKDQAASPFIRPGFDAAKESARRAIADRIKRVL